MKKLQIAIFILMLVVGVSGIIIGDANRRAILNEKSQIAAQDNTKVAIVTPATVASVITKAVNTITPAPVFLTSTVLAVDFDDSVVTDITTETQAVSDEDVVIPEVKVANPVSEEDSLSQRVAAVDVDESYSETPVTVEKVKETMGTSQALGMDVSSWQEEIDWVKVKNAGIEFVMLRIGYRGNTKGYIYEDAYFERNINGALANGIRVGVYFYSMARTEYEAKEEAAWVCDRIKGYDITLPVCFDLEEFDQNRLVGVSDAQLNKNATAFLSYVANKGYTPSLYASKYELRDRWDLSRFDYCEIWLAHWTEKTDYTGRYHMWQYSASGHVDGVPGLVDMDILYYDAPVKTEEKEETPEPEVTPEEVVKEEVKEETTVKETTVDEAYNVTAELKIFEKNNSDEVLLTIPVGERIARITEYDNGWSKVVYGDYTGYVQTESLLDSANIVVIETESEEPVLE